MDKSIDKSNQQEPLPDNERLQLDEFESIDPSVSVLDEFELNFFNSENTGTEESASSEFNTPEISVLSELESEFPDMTMAKPELSDMPELESNSPDIPELESISPDMSEQNTTVTESTKNPFDRFRRKHREKKIRKASNSKLSKIVEHPTIQKGVLAAATLAMIVSLVIVVIVIIGLFQL